MKNTQQEATNTEEFEGIILYTRTVCPKCMLVKQSLIASGVNYKTVNLDHDEVAEAKLREEGIMGLPTAEYKGKFHVDVPAVMKLVSELSD